MRPAALAAPFRAAFTRVRSRAALAVPLLLMTASASSLWGPAETPEPVGALLPGFPDPWACFLERPPRSASAALERAEEGRSLFRWANQTVHADNETVFAAIAVASATGERISPRDVMDVRVETIEICALDLTRAPLPAAVSLTLGVRGVAPSSLLPSNATLVVAFHSVFEREVTLDRDTAMAALALHGTDSDVTLADVLTFREETRAERAFERIVTIDQDDLLVALALGQTGALIEPEPDDSSHPEVSTEREPSVDAASGAAAAGDAKPTVADPPDDAAEKVPAANSSSQTSTTEGGAESAAPALPAVAAGPLP